MSILKDETLIKFIKSKLKTIEGPVSFSLLKPTQKMKDMLGYRPPIIILFGDYHKGNDKCAIECKEEDGCFSFYGMNPSVHNFLNLLTKVARVDLFLELWYDNEYRNKEHAKREYESDVSAIGEFNVFAIPCLYLKKENGKFVRDLSECQIKDYRIHMSDPRSSPQLKNIDSLVSFIISIFKYSTFKKYIYGNFGKDVDPRPFIILALQFLKLGTKEFMRTVFPFHPLIKKYSKTYKQISKLPQELQDLLYNNYDYLPKDNTKNDWMCMLPKNEISDFDFTQFYYPKRDPELIIYKDELIIEVEELYKMIQEMTRKHRLFITKMKGEDTLHPSYNLSNCTFTGFTSGLDLYYLGRTFKKTKDNKMSEISLGYFGNLHLQQITEFLATNDLYTIEQQVYDKSKCLKL